MMPPERNTSGAWRTGSEPCGDTKTFPGNWRSHSGPAVGRWAAAVGVFEALCAFADVDDGEVDKLIDEGRRDDLVVEDVPSTLRAST